MNAIASVDATPTSMKPRSSFFLMPVKSAIAPRIGDTIAISATEAVVMPAKRAVACAGSSPTAA